MQGFEQCSNDSQGCCHQEGEINSSHPLICIKNISCLGSDSILHIFSNSPICNPKIVVEISKDIFCKNSESICWFREVNVIELLDDGSHSP